MSAATVLFLTGRPHCCDHTTYDRLINKAGEINWRATCPHHPDFNYIAQTGTTHRIQYKNSNPNTKQTP